MLSAAITKISSRRALLTLSSSTTTTARAAFSAMPAASEPTRRRRTLDPITITDSAADRLKELLENNKKGAIGIRLGTKRRGCNGLSYTLNYVGEDANDEKDLLQQKNDESLLTKNGIKVYIEPMALMNVVGTTMDWVETELAAEFTFTNPNSKGECGCGESFNV